MGSAQMVSGVEPAGRSVAARAATVRAPNPLLRFARAMVTAATVLLASCGGSGDGPATPEPPPPPAAVAFKGRFVDAPVQGLNYRTSRTSGVTDGTAQFDYWVPGEDVVFSIGSLVIGRGRASGEIHVYELDTTQHEAAADRNTRVAQLLQSLDVNMGAGPTIVLNPTVSARVRADTPLDWTGSQDAFDASLRGLLGDLGLQSQFVTNAAARARADVFLAASLLRCPLDVPPLPVEPGTPTQYRITAGNLSCLDLARINYYRARVAPMLDDQINAGTTQAALVESSFSQQALQDALDINPVLTALDSLDALADFETAAKKKAVVEAVARASQALLGVAKTFVQTLVVFDPPAAGEIDPAKDPQVWIGLTNDVMEVVANGSACVAFVQREADAEAAKCTEAVASTIKAFAAAQGLPGLKLNNEADQRVLNAGLETLAGVFSSASAAQELLVNAGKPKGQLGKAAFGLAAAMVQTARDGVSLAYAVEGQPDPDTGWKAVALGAMDMAVLPVLELGSKCYGGVGGTEVLTCATSIARESGKAVTGLTFASIGTWEAVRNVGLQNEAIVAKSVIEEVLWAGEAGSGSLLQKYFPGESGRTLANSGRELTARIGLVKHDLTAVWSYLEWQKVLWGAVFKGQNAFNMLEARSLANTYLQMVEANTLPNFDAPSINIASQPGASGEVKVRVAVAPGKSGISTGQLRCSANGSLNYAPETPFKGAVSGVTPLDFGIRFSSPGRKGLVCALYTTGAVPRFVGSRAAVLEAALPATSAVTRLLVSPEVPSVGDVITLTAEGVNLTASGFKFSNFPPCDTQGAVAPDSLNDTTMSLRCTAVKAMRLSYVGVVDAQGVPVPGFGQPLTVCPANTRIDTNGSCEPTIDPQVRSLVAAFSADPSTFGGMTRVGSDVYVLSIHQDRASLRRNPDNTPFYKSALTLTKISGNKMEWQSQVAVDVYIGNDPNNLPQSAISLSRSGDAILVASNSYQGTSYGMRFGVYRVAIADRAVGYTPYFTLANVGWHPWFSSDDGVNHFSFAGYFRCLDGRCSSSIQPEAFITESQNRLLASVGLPANLAKPSVNFKEQMLAQLRVWLGL